MTIKLTAEEFDALEGIKDVPALDIKTPLIANLSKRLVELGYAAHGSDGRLVITDKGSARLFRRRCYENLIALSNNPLAGIRMDIADWLGKAGYITPSALNNSSILSGGYAITQRGRDWLASIDPDDA